MKKLDILTATLLIVGGLNWGLVAFADFYLVAAITGAGTFGNKNVLGAVVYGLVGAAAVYQLVSWKRIRSRQRALA